MPKNTYILPDRLNALITEFTEAQNSFDAHTKVTDEIFTKWLDLVNRFNLIRSQGKYPIIRKSIPLPSDAVNKSYGKKLGYCQAVIRFFGHTCLYQIGMYRDGCSYFESYTGINFVVNGKSWEFGLVGELEEQKLLMIQN